MEDHIRLMCVFLVYGSLAAYSEYWRRELDPVYKIAAYSNSVTRGQIVQTEIEHHILSFHRIEHDLRIAGKSAVPRAFGYGFPMSKKLEVIPGTTSTSTIREETLAVDDTMNVANHGSRAHVRLECIPD